MDLRLKPALWSFKASPLAVTLTELASCFAPASNAAMAASLSAVASLANCCAVSAAVSLVCAVVMSVPNAASVGVVVGNVALPVNAVLMFVHCWMMPRSDRPRKFNAISAILVLTGCGGSTASKNTPLSYVNPGVS